MWHVWGWWRCYAHGWPRRVNIWSRWGGDGHGWGGWGNSGDHDWWSKFCWSFEDACKKAAKEQERWARDADRDAQLRRDRAAALLALSVKAEAA